MRKCWHCELWYIGTYQHGSFSMLAQLCHFDLLASFAQIVKVRLGSKYSACLDYGVLEELALFSQGN